MVHILSGGKSVGIGLVLTQSGKVLTTYQPAKGTQNLSAEYVLSGATFKATVIGTDPAADLALLQMASRPGWPFVTVEVGNSDRLAENAKISDFTSYHLARHGLRHRGRHHGHDDQGDHRCRHPDRHERDRRRRQHQQNPERADGVDAAV